MFGWGDDNPSSMIESSGVLLPWLIWIQILVFFLLILLLSSFFGIHLSASPYSPASSGVDTGDDYSSPVVSISHRRQSLQGERDGNIAGQQRITNTRNGTAGAAVNLAGRDSFLTYNLEDSRSLKHPNHPCRYLELATRAFLGCLGLSSAPMNQSPRDTEDGDAND